MIKLSAVVITFNEEKNVARCLRSLQGVADEVVVVDSGSTDGTAEVCKSLGAKFVPHAWEGYGLQKQFAVAQATHDWVINLDADEVVTPALAGEIRRLFSQDDIPCAAYNLRITLNFLGRTFKYGTEKGQPHLRLFNKKKARFTSCDVHEKLRVDDAVGTLKGEVLHYSYHNLEHQLVKFNTYTTILANDAVKKGKKAHKWAVGFSLLIRFLTWYFVRLNFLNGYEGFVWSVIGAYYKFIRSCKQIELRATATS